MPATSALISLVPNGVVPTIAALRALDVSTVGENATVTVLGSGVANDGFGGPYAFIAGSSATDDGGNSAVGTPTTGRWVKAATFAGLTGVGPVAVTQGSAAAASSFNGSRESFVLLSGNANTTIYSLPPAAGMNGQTIRFKQIGTGAYTIRTSVATDRIYDTTGLAVQIPHNPLRSGQSFDITCFGPVFYTV